MRSTRWLVRAVSPAWFASTMATTLSWRVRTGSLGYLTSDDASRTNVFHLPVGGSGDGGIYSTLADVSAFWRALFAGRIGPRTGWPS